MSTTYSNKLETYFYGTPSLVQEVLQEPFKWANETLHAVTGDPQAIMAAAGEYVRIAEKVQAIGEQQVSDRNALVGLWTDDAFAAFSMRVDEIDTQITDLAAATRQVKDVLDQGAQACVEGADLVIDLVIGLIMYAISLIAVNVALSIVTAGTSLAAGVAAVVARSAVVLAKVARVVERVAKVMGKVIQVLRRVTETADRIKDRLLSVVKLLRKLEAHLKEAKKAHKTAETFKDKMRARGSFAAQNGGVSLVIKAGTFGVVDPVTVGSAGTSGGENYIQGILRGQDAVEATREDEGK